MQIRSNEKVEKREEKKDKLFCEAKINISHQNVQKLLGVVLRNRCKKKTKIQKNTKNRVSSLHLYQKIELLCKYLQRFC